MAQAKAVDLQTHRSGEEAEEEIEGVSGGMYNCSNNSSEKQRQTELVKEADRSGNGDPTTVLLERSRG